MDRHKFLGRSKWFHYLVRSLEWLILKYWRPKNLEGACGWTFGKGEKAPLRLTVMSPRENSLQRKEPVPGLTKSWTCACQAVPFLGHLVLVQGVSEMGMGWGTWWPRWILNMGQIDELPLTKPHLAISISTWYYPSFPPTWKLHKGSYFCLFLFIIHQLELCLVHNMVSINNCWIKQYYDLFMQPAISRGQPGWKKQPKQGPESKNFYVLFKEQWLVVSFRIIWLAELLFYFYFLKFLLEYSWFTMLC